MNIKYQKGQTLVVLLVYMVIAIIVTTASIALVMNSSWNTDKLYQGTTALDVAENGIELAVIQVIRDPSYTGGTLSLDGGTAVITVTGTDPKIITSQGTMGNFTRTVQASLNTTNNIYVISSWQEQ